ncbi:S8 family peptidase [Streptomyces sp. NPDC048200]|uniref:S8 family peptidase n=1 Tax=Streptomyces sp. NPDC048200 TaxID=3365512 RepID=UPI00372105FB
MRRDRPHLIVRRPAITETYTRPEGGGGGGKKPPAPTDREVHASALLNDLQTVEAAGIQLRANRPVEIPGALDGIYVEFESFPGIELATQSLDPQVGKLHPELVSVRSVETNVGVSERATVFVPSGKLSYFVKKIDEYLATADQSAIKNRNLVDRIGEIRIASISALWTDDPALLPERTLLTWWEIWLRVRDGEEIARFQAFAQSTGVRVHRHAMKLPESVVLLVFASLDQLSQALVVLDDLAELRRPNHAAEVLAMESSQEQASWVAQLADRLQSAPKSSPAACILDTGVYRQHPLLAASLDDADCHAADPIWRNGDHAGHGTEMAGLALFGDVGQALLADGPIYLRHRLESVKILPPPPGSNEPDIYGSVVARATDQVEIEKPHRRRVFSMAVTATGGNYRDGSDAVTYGQPTSWSASLDALAFGHSVDVTEDGVTEFLRDDENPVQRLFVVSGGNVQAFEADHLSRSDLEPIEDPGQSWNSLTIGAYTERDDMSEAHPGYSGWYPLSQRGDLSPFSRTGVSFSRLWPAKPEIVLEGGNVAISPDRTSFDTPENLQVLTTKAPIQGSARQLTVTAATSAATSQAANIAAGIMAEYPNLWPESVRALMVHSAEWTPIMKQRIESVTRKSDRLALLRRYGMGVPDLSRATQSAANALTLIAQEVIHPFDGKSHTREMHLHDLPWPGETLLGLGSVKVRLRVTLSYFIDPNPARRGWRRRYSYASHGLRFDMRRATESNDDFRKRINKQALAEDENRPVSNAETGKWLFGVKHQQAPGSLHSDIWVGDAAELAQRGALAVYPVSGWWKENPKRDGSEAGARYSMVVSIEAPEQDVDIWTPVAQQISIPISVSS